MVNRHTHTEIRPLPWGRPYLEGLEVAVGKVAGPVSLGSGGRGWLEIRWKVVSADVAGGLPHTHTLWSEVAGECLGISAHVAWCGLGSVVRVHLVFLVDATGHQQMWNLCYAQVVPSYYVTGTDLHPQNRIAEPPYNTVMEMTDLLGYN